LAPLAHLRNLSNLTLLLNENSIGDKGAKYLLAPLSHLINLSHLKLSLERNEIEVSGA